MLLYRQTLTTGDDVFAARQRGRVIAGLVGFDEADQVRIATALSEVGRDAVAGQHAGDRSFEVSVDDDQLTIVVAGFGSAQQADADGLAAARRLMTSAAIDQVGDDDVRVVMRRRLALPMSPDELDATRTKVATTVMATPLDELRAQNRELVDTLERLNARQLDLVRLNTELEETNRGVMAMYAQLSDELDSTNRGVVALYAELDDKTRQLQLASESKSRFLSNVSHELRSPVTTILGLTQLLAEFGALAADPARRHQLDLIHQSADELLELVSQLLDLAKAEAGRLDPHVSLGDLLPVVRGVLRSLAATTKPGVELVDALGSGVLLAEIDVDLLRQVVRNVVVNAIAFTEHGTVTVSAGRHGDGTVRIDVTDTGVGIDDADLDRIFEEFFQVRGPLQHGRRGTGLGLPYSRKVVETLGGTLTATSAMGAGSTFTIALRGLPSARSGALHSLTVLVVDDDPAFCALVTGWLGSSVARLRVARGGEEAIGALRRDGADVVLLDLVMSDVTGLDVLRRIAADAQLADIPVVVVTSLDVNAALGRELSHARLIVTKDALTRDNMHEVINAAIGSEG